LLIHAAVGSWGGAGGFADEPLGVPLVGRVEHVDSGGVQLCGVAVVECGRGHQPDPGMTMSMVVPVDERPAVSAGVVDVVKPGGELGPVLQGLEVGLRVGVVAGGVRPAMRLGDPEIR